MLKRLPLILMTVMVAVGLVMEQFAFGRMQWISKIPVVLLLLFAFFFSKTRHDVTVR
jgi:hypothetical protein